MPVVGGDEFRKADVSSGENSNGCSLAPRDEHDVKVDLADALDRLEVGDRELLAFLPESNRLERVLADVDLTVRRSDDAEPPDLIDVLVGVKDVINVDGLPTRAGSELPATLFEGPEATIVQRLRASGALIAGKTTTTEFAFSEPGPTRNPRDLKRTPGGSSSGSAAAVASGLVPIALATQTVDSTVTPAAYCGVVGYKPTYQRMPLDGVIPFAPSMDHGGLITTDIATARVAAAVVCDGWKGDSSASGVVLGVPADEYLHRAEKPAIEAFAAVIEALRREGFDIVRTSSLANIEPIALAHRRLVTAEFSRVHTDWFSQHGDHYRRRSAGLYLAGADLPESAITEGRESGKILSRSLEDTMQQEGIVAWVSPSATGVAPLGLDYIGDPIMGLPWTHAHVPVVTLPATPSFEGLPVGIQLAGRIGGDEELLALASLVEVALKAKGP